MTPYENANVCKDMKPLSKRQCEILLSQFDPTDGTIGNLQLVRRWFVCDASGGIFTARKGRHSHPSQEAAQDVTNAYTAGNSGLPGLKPRPFWCYPGHHDPVGPVRQRPPALWGLGWRR